MPMSGLTYPAFTILTPTGHYTVSPINSPIGYSCTSTDQSHPSCREAMHTRDYLHEDSVTCFHSQTNYLHTYLRTRYQTTDEEAYQHPYRTRIYAMVPRTLGVCVTPPYNNYLPYYGYFSLATTTLVPLHMYKVSSVGGRTPNAPTSAKKKRGRSGYENKRPHFSAQVCLPMVDLTWQ